MFRCFQLLIERKRGTGETPQERKRRGGSAAARGKRSLARKSTAV
ncbi:hypothetical protein [Priestia megaterium]|nr:hypothetical protein [Priestia megaterium]MCU7739086.1 hypothetical protein [Priestia megaterium]